MDGADRDLTRGWREIRAWRVAKRAELLALRRGQPPALRTSIAGEVAALIAHRHPEIADGCIGFYWPIRAELDMRPFVRDCIARGADAALPVVIEPNRPLQFWTWRPRAKMARGIWDIPIPAECEPAQPTALLVPLLGFDGAGYRLGNGGGYYDRTLAAMNPRPIAIGVGTEACRLDTIHPQPHDVRLDATVTEAGFVWHRPEAAALAADDDERQLCFASPPCFAHELDPSWLGYLTRGETTALLNTLLEAERAGARASTVMASQATADCAAALRTIRHDEAVFCAMLGRQLRRLGETPGTAMGEFLEKVWALDSLDGRIGLLSRGQAWVVRTLANMLPRIDDPELRAVLRDMLHVHDRNAALCRQLSPDASAALPAA